MIERNSLFRMIETTVSEHRYEMLQETLDAALNAGIPPEDIRRALMRGFEQVRHKLMSQDASIPDFLLCIDTIIESLQKLFHLSQGDAYNEGGIPLVIGVVEGDPHDLGKNIISAVYRTCGYRVFDLGCYVPNESFVKSVLENAAQVLALSAMMSTVLTSMLDIIKEVKLKSPDTVIMIGGAALDENLAMSFGADGYSETAVTVLEETEATIKRVREGIPWLSSSQC